MKLKAILFVKFMNGNINLCRVHLSYTTLLEKYVIQGFLSVCVSKKCLKCRLFLYFNINLSNFASMRADHCWTKTIGLQLVITVRVSDYVMLVGC